MATPLEYRQTDDEREGLTLRDYLGVMWRRKWIIILVTVVATGAAFGFSYRQAKVYQAQADLIYQQQLDVANPLTGQSYTDPTQRTSLCIVVADRARIAKAMKTEFMRRGYTKR